MVITCPPGTPPCFFLTEALLAGQWGGQSGPRSSILAPSCSSQSLAVPQLQNVLWLAQTLQLDQGKVGLGERVGHTEHKPPFYRGWPVSLTSWSPLTTVGHL